MTGLRFNRAALFALMGVVVALALGLASSQLAQATNYRYVAHQGRVNKTYPGNTVEAITQASKTAGIWGIETDVFRTKDGKWVCIHGSGGTSASWEGLNVLKSKRATLLAKKTAKGYSMPSLEKYLDLCKSGGKIAVIEVKDKRISTTESYAKDLVDVIHKKGMLGKCMFISFQARAVANAKNYAKTKYSVSVIGSLIANSSSAKEIDSCISKVKKYKLNGLSLASDLMDNGLAKTKSAGVHLRCAIHSDEVAARKACQKGVYAVTTEFTPVKYTVTFKDGVDGKVLKTQSVVYGASATAPGVPKHTGHAFSKWSRSIANITGNTTITANYTVHTYKVVFKDGVDGKVLNTQTVAYGKSASAPTPPKHAGHTFTKWNQAATNITADTTITANYTVNKYKVVFKDGVDGKVLKTQTVAYGKSASAPTPLKYTGKTFTGWSRSVANITTDTTITAEYSVNKYNVIFKDTADGKVLKNESVAHGKAAGAPKVPAHAGYTFKKWNKAYSKVTSNLTVSTVYDLKKYTVTFKDGIDGKVIATRTVEHGKSASAPGVPVHKGKKFSGWSRTLANITANTTITANYANAQYMVTFKDGVDGKILKTQVIDYGKAATAPTAPAHSGYTFKGWDKTFSSVTSNITVTAIYMPPPAISGLTSIRDATVIDKDGKEMTNGKSVYAYAGGSPVCPVKKLRIGTTEVSKGQFLTYYFKNRKCGTATVVLRGVHSAGYKDAIILKFRIL